VFRANLVDTTTVQLTFKKFVQPGVCVWATATALLEIFKSQLATKFSLNNHCRADFREFFFSAGRVRAGKCYRLCTEDLFRDQLLDMTIPEMQRKFVL